MLVAFVRTNVHIEVMKIRGIEWDHGNWPKCGKHGATKDEIEHVLERVAPFPIQISMRLDL